MSRKSLGVRVVEAVAEERDVSPLDVDARLYSVVDPDALDRLFAPTSNGKRRGDGQVVFDFDGRVVTVYADGSVSVDGREPA